MDDEEDKEQTTKGGESAGEGNQKAFDLMGMSADMYQNLLQTAWDVLKDDPNAFLNQMNVNQKPQEAPKKAATGNESGTKTAKEEVIKPKKPAAPEKPKEKETKKETKPAPETKKTKEPT